MDTAAAVSHWSRPRVKRTDHWSKLKSKSYYHTLTPQGNYICYCRPQYYDSSGLKYSRRPSENPTHMACSVYSHHFKKSAHPMESSTITTATKSRSTLALVGSPELNRQLSEIGSLELPTASQWWWSRAPQGGRGRRRENRVPSASSHRAKEGFQYWPQEQTKHTKLPSVKGSLGSRATFLGIGIPRL